MMRRIPILTYALISCVFVSQAQDLTGAWQGTTASLGNKGPINIEIHIEQSPGSIDGFSYLYFDNKKFIKEDLRGIFRPHIRKVVLKEENILESKIGEGWNSCVKTFSLIYNLRNNEETLTGHWYGYASKDTTACPEGEIVLKRVVETVFKPGKVKKEDAAALATARNEEVKKDPAIADKADRPNEKSGLSDESASIKADSGVMNTAEQGNKKTTDAGEKSIDANASSKKENTGEQQDMIVAKNQSVKTGPAMNVKQTVSEQAAPGKDKPDNANGAVMSNTEKTMAKKEEEKNNAKQGSDATANEVPAISTDSGALKENNRDPANKKTDASANKAATSSSAQDSSKKETVTVKGDPANQKLLAKETENTITGNDPQLDRIEGNSNLKLINSEKQKDSSQLGKRKLPEIPLFLNRITKPDQFITVPDAHLTIELYDNAEVDGDVVSLYYNRKPFVTRQILTATAQTMELNLDPSYDEHEIVFYADDLGAVPPTVGYLVIHSGDKEYKLTMSADLNQNACVKIRLQK